MASEDYIVKLRAEFEDKISARLGTLQDKLKLLDGQTKKAKEIKIVARDKASATIDVVRNKIKVLKDQRAGIDIKAHTEQAEANLKELARAKKELIKAVRMNVTVNTAESRAKVEELKGKVQGLQTLCNKDMKFKARADVKEAQANFDGLQSSLATLKNGADIRATLIDLATKGLSKIWELTKKVAKGVVITVGVAGVRAAKTGIESLASEQRNKVTINRVFKNSGMSNAEAVSQSGAYYKDLENFSMKTPFTPDQMAFFGTKARQIEKGNRSKAFDTSKMMANVAAFRSDRTPDEIAEAFFSASVGNMEMMNNLLGTHYSNWQEAVKGIGQDYDGMVEELSTTLPGAWSTFVGIVQASCKEMMRPFGERAAGAMAHVSERMLSLKDFIGQNSEQFGDFGARIETAFQPATDSIDAIFDRLESGAGLELIEGLMGGVTEFIEGVSTGAGAAMEMITNTLTSVDAEQITGFGQIAGATIGLILQGIALVVSGMIQIGAFIGDVVAKWNWLCTTITTKWNRAISYVKTWWTNFKTQWDSDVQAVKTAWSNACKWIGDKFKTVCENVKSWWQGVKDFLSHPIQTAINTFGFGNALGKDRVPYDNYPARLHEGERVLSRREADLYDKNKNKTFSRIKSDDSTSSRTTTRDVVVKIADQIVVRNDSDIERIVDELVRVLKVQLA